MAEQLPELQRDDRGDAVVELQMRLAGFRGTVPDGEYGPGTELQVRAFQRDWMKMESSHGRADPETIAAIERFGATYPVDFQSLRCACGVCPGFGRGKFKGSYSQRGRSEAFHRYEYPGIHRMLLWAFRAAMFYADRSEWRLTINSGYRCSEDNRIHNRTSTNHHGKAIDIDILDPPSKRIDMERCDALRGKLVETANAQIGWSGLNRKALEPADIAPTWVHYDVRSYEPKYLADIYFVTDQRVLDAVPR